MEQTTGNLTRSIAAYYGNQADGYDSPDNIRFYSKLTKMLCSVAMAYGPSVEKILEVGCGTGISTRIISECFPEAAVMGLDPTQPFLERAKDRLSSSVDLSCMSLAEFEPDAEMDVVVGNMCLHWLSRDERLALPLLIKPGGMAVFSLPVRELSVENVSGNMWLRRAVRETMDAAALRLIPREWRGLTETDLVIPGLSTVFYKRLDITEELEPEAFLETISTRGTLLGLFGARADAARTWLAERLPEGETIRLRWRVAVFGARRD